MKTQRLAVSLFGLFICLSISQAVHAQYYVERLNSNFTQPIYLTQPPGDNDNVFVVERGDSSSNLGQILVHNLATGSNSLFLDVIGGFFQDAGLVGLTFHPEFQTNGLFYITVAEGLDNRLEEYQANPSNYSQVPIFTRTLIQFDAIEGYHTINWCGFRPGTNELFVCCGDGGPQANDVSEFDIAKIEDPNSLFGKLLRIDPSESFPSPATDALHPGVDVLALGLRNPYRGSFTPNGGMFIGDVGFTVVEEINYIPASHFAGSNPPIDFGWVDREGTVATQTFNPDIDGTSGPNDIDPIFDYLHFGTNSGSIGFPHPSLIRGNSITSGYLYNGRLLFADFIGNRAYSGEFDEATDPTTFDGTNLTDIREHTLEFEQSIFDDIDFISSFAVDNAGNLYVLDFGDGYFPPSGSGEIFRILPHTGVIDLDDATQVNESGESDVYKVFLPVSGNVEVTAATASADIEISTDNVIFSSSATLTLSSSNFQTVYARAINDVEQEGIETATILHLVSASDDPSYPIGTDIGNLEVKVGDDDIGPLVHRYTFNKDSADDSIGNAHGIAEGNALITGGELFLFGGGWGDAYVDLPDGIASAASLNGNQGEITVEAWVSLFSNSNWAVIFSLGNSGPTPLDGNGFDGYYWQLIPQNGSNGNLRSLTAVPYADMVTDDNAVLPTVGEIHVANVLNATENSNRIYVNGVLQAVGQLPQGFDPSTFGVVGDNQNWIGRSQWNDPGLNGQINEFRIYNTALDAAAVADSFAMGPTEPGILGDVNCDGEVNLLDVQPFIDLLSSGGFSDKADINGDGSVNLLDVDPFIALLAGN